MGKRLAKSPKLYFLDTGLLCYLSGLRDPFHALQGPMAGALFENAVFAELFRSLIHRGEIPRIYFWRTSAGDEVDFVVDWEGKLTPIESKLTETPRPLHGEGMRKFVDLFKGETRPGVLVCMVKKSGQINPSCRIVPYGALR